MTTTPDLTAKKAVLDAYKTVVAAYPNAAVTAHPDGQGGLWVEIADHKLGPAYMEDDTFVVFNLPFNLPGGDIYPMFVRPDLHRSDHAPLGDAFQATQLSWTGEPQNRQVTQISRRTRDQAFTAQTAAQKVAKVLHWMEHR